MKNLKKEQLQIGLVLAIATIILSIAGCGKYETPVADSPASQATSTVTTASDVRSTGAVQASAQTAKAAAKPSAVSLMGQQATAQRRGSARMQQSLATREALSVSAGGPNRVFLWREGAAFTVTIKHGTERLNLFFSTNSRIPSQAWNPSFLSFANSNNGTVPIKVWRIRNGEFLLLETKQIPANNVETLGYSVTEDFQLKDIIFIENNPALLFAKDEQNNIISPVASFIQNKSGDATTLPGTWMRIYKSY